MGGRRLTSPPEPADQVPPLTGFTVGVTAARRAEEFEALLQRRGAAVVQAPAIRIIPLVDDEELRHATEAVIADPPDIVVATTGIGFRGWICACALLWGISAAALGFIQTHAQFYVLRVLIEGERRNQGA